MAWERLGTMIRHRRTALGMSLRELATKVGTTHVTLSRVERGQQPPFLDGWRMLATVGVTPLELAELLDSGRTPDACPCCGAPTTDLEQR